MLRGWVGFALRIYQLIGADSVIQGFGGVTGVRVCWTISDWTELIGLLSSDSWTDLSSSPNKTPSGSM